MSTTERPPLVTDEHLEYLDDLRDSGTVNMFGARPYLQEAFELDRGMASKILSYWTETFEERGCAETDAKGGERNGFS